MHSVEFFPSKKDWWLTVMLVGFALLELIAGIALLIEGSNRWAGGLLLTASVFIVWLMQSTFYAVNETNLVIRSGPFRWTVPLHEIQSIMPTRNPLSSPALSLDRLWIDYRRGNAKRAIMISPREKPQFLQAVAERVPDLESDGVRVNRK